MYNMHMVVMYYYTITKIQLLTRKCKKVILNICFVTWKTKKKEVHRKKQMIKLTNTKAFCPQRHTFLKTNWPNISQSFGVSNVFFAYLLSKSQSGNKLVIFSNGCLDLSANILISYMVCAQNVR